jgi:glycosyltransferase involved in cell wall biosynthesis
LIELSRNDAFKREPLVSVLMLAYKHEPYIAEAIEGVLAQKCAFPFELIVAEDCSPDGTRAITERYLEQHPSMIRIVTGEKNIGTMPNFYRALERCRGKYIAFCEGDDYWCDPEKLTKQVAILEADDEVGMVHGNFRDLYQSAFGWHLSEAGAHDKRPKEELKGDVFAINIRELVPRTCTAIYRREALNRMRETPLANPSFLIGDVQLVVFTSAHYKIDYCPDVVAVYRHAPNSLTRSGLASTVRRMQTVIEIYDIFDEMFSHRSDHDPRAVLPYLSAQAKAAFRLNDGPTFEQAYDRIRNIAPRSSMPAGLRLRRLILRNTSVTNASNAIIDLLR